MSNPSVSEFCIMWSVTWMRKQEKKIKWTSIGLEFERKSYPEFIKLIVSLDIYQTIILSSI